MYNDAFIPASGTQAGKGLILHPSPGKFTVQRCEAIFFKRMLSVFLGEICCHLWNHLLHAVRIFSGIVIKTERDSYIRVFNTIPVHNIKVPVFPGCHNRQVSSHRVAANPMKPGGIRNGYRICKMAVRTQQGIRRDLCCNVNRCFIGRMVIAREPFTGAFWFAVSENESIAAIKTIIFNIFMAICNADIYYLTRIIYPVEHDR